MAQNVPLHPGNSEVTVTAHGRVTWVPSPLLSPPGGLFPLMSAGFEIDDYRILNGWPVPVPDIDIQIQCQVSAEGDVLTVRDDPTALVTNADMRWIADSNFYDQMSGQWTPIQSNVSPWKSDTTSTPTLLTNYEYTFGDERFNDRSVLNFDSDTRDYMYNDLSLKMGGTEGYTLIMVLNPNSFYGNDETVVENALWAPWDTTGAWVMFSVRDHAVWMTTESTPPQRGVAFGDALTSTAPSYLAIVVGRPLTTMYAAPGPAQVQVKSLVAGEAPESVNTRFWLGNSPVTGAETIDMALMDLGVYAKPLTKDEVVAEFAELCKIYGGDT